MQDAKESGKNAAEKKQMPTFFKEKKVSNYAMVPVAGVEPARCCHRRILNPVRLPIPSHRQFWFFPIWEEKQGRIE